MLMPRRKKPKKEELLIEKLLLRLVSPLNALPVQTSDAVVFIRPENIAYIKTNDKEVQIFTVDGKKWSRFDSLSKLEKKLKADPRFYRAHRSYLVNLYQVETLKKVKGKQAYKLSFKGKVKGKADLANSKKTDFEKHMEI